MVLHYFYPVREAWPAIREESSSARLPAVAFGIQDDQEVEAASYQVGLEKASCLGPSAFPEWEPSSCEGKTLAEADHEEEVQEGVAGLCRDRWPCR